MKMNMQSESFGEECRKIQTEIGKLNRKCCDNKIPTSDFQVDETNWSLLNTKINEVIEKKLSLLESELENIQNNSTEKRCLNELENEADDFKADYRVAKEDFVNQLKSFGESIIILKCEVNSLVSRFDKIENAVSTKADFELIHQKVSIEYFEATKRGLTNSMLELISQLAAREHDWQKSLSEMNKIVELKMNKDEISPFKEYLNQKVECIQDRLKSLNVLKKETEAAGTKYRLMKGVKCISCDNNAMMKIIETSPVPKKEPLLKKISHNHFFNKLNEQVSLKAKGGIQRAQTASAAGRKAVIKEKRVKSSTELTKQYAH
jgi:Domain of unknown function (DUF4795)